MTQVAQNIEGKNATHICVICMDTSKADISAKCAHPVCHQCARHYFNGLLHKAHFDSSERIICPDHNCKQVFGETDDIIKQFFSTEEVQDWWNRAIIKTFIKNKMYCPMENCSGLFDVDSELTKRCTFSECYECHRGFCLACQKAWHPGEDYMRDDTQNLEQTLNLAKNNCWTRCPGCSYIVEMRNGCNHIQCHCGISFCYGCGRGEAVCRGECFNLGTRRLNELRVHMFVNKEDSSSR